MNKHLITFNYHGVQAAENEYAWRDCEKPYVLSAEALEQQLNFLKCFELESKDVNDVMNGNLNLSKNSEVMLTFDDGHISHYDYVMPLLKDLGFKGTFFVSAGLVGEDSYMSWTDLRTLGAEGFRIGAHGYDHVPLTRLNKDKLKHELHDAKKVIEDGLGCAVDSFSVPRGFFNARVGREARLAGYKVICNSHTGYNKGEPDPFYIKRFAIHGRTEFEEFKSICRGDWIDRGGREALKEKMRRYVSPDFYDWLAHLKNKRALREDETRSC